MHFARANIRNLHIHLPASAMELATQPLAFATRPAFPAIAAPWSGIDGIYAGITRADGAEPDGHLVLLNATPGRRMGHAEAIEWAASLGDGAQIPSKTEGALLAANLRAELLAERWIWLREQSSARGAWYQDFNYGLQYGLGMEAEGGVRAVRRLPL
ncbi:hypothetical protein GCM10010975_26840 [Comamonas phosphati]|nr:hypothetical protein GCM10010975_26840 [Comamonas phosphati]